MSHGLHRQPPGFLEILTRGPRPWSERRHGVDRPKPARGVTGGEGDLGEKEEEAEPHPWVPVARRERVEGERAAVDSETAAKALVGGVLRWHWAAMVEMVSTGRSVGCSWEG